MTAQTAELLAETLDAARVVDPGAAQLLRSGQLTSALRHVGFGVVDEIGGLAQLAPVQPRVVRRSSPARATGKPPQGSRRTPQMSRQAQVDRTLEQRRAAQQTRADQADVDYAEADAERDRAEQALDAHQHRMADLKADLERLNEQLEQTREALRGTRKQTRCLQRDYDQAARNAVERQHRQGSCSGAARVASFWPHGVSAG